MLVVGENDVLVRAPDFNRLKAVLPDSAVVKNIEDYNHCDYMWASDANVMVNQYVFQFFEEHKL